MNTLVTQKARAVPLTRAAVKPKANTNGKATARKQKRSEDSVTMQITTTKAVIRALDAIKGSGLYGNSRAAAAERILAKGIEQLLREGTLIRLAKFFDKSK